MKQKTLRVFEVEDFEKLKNVIESKYALVSSYYFMLKEENQEIEKFLREKNLNYFVLNSNRSFTSKKETIETKKEEIKIIEKEIIKYKAEPFKIFDKIIRSGEEINLTSNAVFLKRINTGAKIDIKGCVFILDENNGFVRCEGDCLFVKKNNSHIIFNNEELEQNETEKFYYKDKK